MIWIRILITHLFFERHSKTLKIIIISTWRRCSRHRVTSTLNLYIGDIWLKTRIYVNSCALANRQYIHFDRTIVSFFFILRWHELKLIELGTRSISGFSLLVHSFYCSQSLSSTPTFDILYLFNYKLKVVSIFSLFSNV